MRVLAVLLSLAAAAPVVAQSSVYSAATPPDPAALARLNLKTEWTAAIPVAGRADGVALVQVADADQVFAQTRAGLLAAFDAATGAQQWSVRYDSPNASVFPVAVTDRHVIAVNVTKLYAIHRFTGQIELTYNMPLNPTGPPAADGDQFYIAVSGNRLAAFELPSAVRVPDRTAADRDARAGEPRTRNPADVVAARNPSAGRASLVADDRFEERRVRLSAPGESGVGVANLQRAPSINLLPSVVPPYRMFDADGRYIQRTESLDAVPALRQPYRRTSPTGQIQRTPSIQVMPPSVALIYERVGLRNRGGEPALMWVYTATARLADQPLVTPQRVWSATASPLVLAVLRDNRRPQVAARMSAAPAAPPARAGTVGYFPLADGNLLAVDLTLGGGEGLNLVWRANVGGLMNRRPVPTADGVYQAGDYAGVARLDPAVGAVVWRTAPQDDFLLAVNREYAYVRDHRGRVHAYDRYRVDDPGTRRAVSVGTVDLGDFNVPVTNDRTDRIFLAADNGLFVCLRDASAKYATPYRVSAEEKKPEPKPEPKPDAKPPAAPMGDAPPARPPGEQQKEPEKKE